MITNYESNLINDRQYLVNFDINSLYGNVISNVYLDTLFDIKLTKAHYQHFVRLYNRRKYHSAADLIAAGYTCVTPKWSWDILPDELVWCKQNLKPGSFILHNNQFYFAHESDTALFKLRWSS